MVATVVLLAGLGVGIWFLFARDGSPPRSDAAGTGSTNAGPPEATAPPTLPPSTIAPSTIPAVVSGPPAGTNPAAAPTLVPVPVAGSTMGGATSTKPTAPVAGSVGIRLFNGFTPGETLDVWEMSDHPQKYGSLPYGGYAAIQARGALAPTGVELHLRFVPAGGDPNAAPDPATGPWSWNLVPTAGSRQTLVLVDDGGLHITRIDDRRAAGAAKAGAVHVVPIAQHLQVGGSRDLRWGIAGLGCIGATTSSKDELDLPRSAGLQLSSARDTTCASPFAGPVTLPGSGAAAVIALRAGGGRAELVVLPLA